jgi:transcriptional regulator with XRE-family HTH domain
MVVSGMELLGRWIRESRVAAGMTQAQLARLAGMHQTTLSRLERGRLEGLRLHRLAALIAVLDSRLGNDLEPIVAARMAAASF